MSCTIGIALNVRDYILVCAGVMGIWELLNLQLMYIFNILQLKLIITLPYKTILIKYRMYALYNRYKVNKINVSVIYSIYGKGCLAFSQVYLANTL